MLHESLNPKSLQLGANLGGQSLVQEERRQYSLAILIILVIFCWPAAILYYFTRPKTITTITSTPMRTCLGCGAQIRMDYAVCPHCGRRVDFQGSQVPQPPSGR